MVLCSTSPLQTAVLDLTLRDLRAVPQSGTAMEAAGPSNLPSGASQPDADNDGGATQPAVPTAMLSHHDCRGAKPKAPPQVAWQSADYVEQPAVPGGGAPLLPGWPGRAADLPRDGGGPR